MKTCRIFRGGSLGERQRADAEGEPHSNDALIEVDAGQGVTANPDHLTRSMNGCGGAQRRGARLGSTSAGDSSSSKALDNYHEYL